MKYHALFVIFEKAAKFDIGVCCKLLVALYELNAIYISVYMYSIGFNYGMKNRVDTDRRASTEAVRSKTLLY